MECSLFKLLYVSDCQKHTMKHLLLALNACLALTSPTWASCTVDISDYVGWQIIHSGTVTGYIDDNGVEQDDFEGCEWGRQLIIDYSLAVTCVTYNYSYAYNPDIVVLSNGSSLAACIDDEMYDVQR